MADKLPAWALEEAKPAVPSWAQEQTASKLPASGSGDPTANEEAFLRLLSKAEGHGPNTITGGKTFTDMTKHPRVVGVITKDGKSTAAGSYAITAQTYDDYAPKLGITDFSEASQRKIAIEIIKRNGALGDVQSGNYEAAINKLGGIWASLPSSKYGQSHRTWDWVSQELGKPVGVAAAPGSPAVQPGAAPAAPLFGPAPKDADPAKLNQNADWIKASTILYQMYEPNKPVPKSADEITEYGKDVFGWFNGNMAYMAAKAATLAKNGTPEQKQAFLYMMDTYGDTQFSWEGAGRAIIPNLTDPTNLIGFGTFGVGFIAKATAKQGAKMEIRSLLAKSVARTGIVAGIDTAIVVGGSDAIQQSVEVTAGRREEIDLTQVGAKAAVGFVGGLVLGTAADLAVSKVAKVFKNRKAGKAKAENKTRVEPEMGPEVNAAAASPEGAPAGVVPEAAPVAPITPKKTAVVADETPLRESLRSVAAEVEKTGWTDALKAERVRLEAEIEKVQALPPSEGRWYHGTASVVENFKPGRADATFVSRDAKFAADFANISEKVKLDAEKGIAGPNILPVKVEVQNAFDYNKPEQVAEVLRLLEANGATPARLKEVKEGAPNGYWPIIESKDVQAAIKAAGHDAFYIIEGDTKNLAIYDATKVKSVFGAAPDVAGNNANLGSTLTAEEIAAATARQQSGRLPADNTVPQIDGAPIAIEIPEMNTGMRSTRVAGEAKAVYGDKELAADSEFVVKQIRDLPDQELTKALEQLRTGQGLASGPPSMEQQRIIARATKQIADELDVATAEAVKAQQKLMSKKTLSEADNLEIQRIGQQILALENRKISANLGDDAFGTMAGNMLRDRQSGLSGIAGVTPESIMAEKNIPIEEARQIWAEMVSKSANEAEAKKVADTYDTMAKEAMDAGDFETARTLGIKKQRELYAMNEQAMPGSASLVNMANEFAISNVFSPTTVQVNLAASGVKTLVIPALKLIATDPFAKASRVEAAAAYGAMKNSFGAAVRGAVTGFKYEQALLTRDGARLVEGELALPTRLGGLIRLYPRILNASDEFLSRINYDSFIASRAASQAAMDGAEKGLTGDALDTFIKEASKTALEGSRSLGKVDDLIQPIINKGYNLGYRGDKLFDWAESQIALDPKAYLPKMDAWMKDADALRKGTDEEALAFVRDVLYKKPFSGEGAFSKAAIRYEDFMKDLPVAKLVLGQLFFRTPVRVFEEGVRLTPGLQLIAPNFIADLAGKNGTLRQVRANVEAQSSLAITASVLSLYANGAITGDEPYDNQEQKKLRLDGKLPPLYSIKLPDGSYWVYKNFDPIATPVKIMVNGLRRMEKLQLKMAQGEDVPPEQMDAALAYITVATAAVATAFRDANLLAGAKSLYTLGENIADPEAKEGAWLKYTAEKLSLLVPNTLHKIAKDNDPQIKDPQLFWSVVEDKLARPFGQEIEGVVTPYSYDYLGNVRTRADSGSLWNIFSVSTEKELSRNLSPEALELNAKLADLQWNTNALFKTPVKHKELGGTDLRTIVASDGKSTLFDVWQKNYRELIPEEKLLPLVNSALPEGTFAVRGSKVKEVQNMHDALQEAAFQQMKASEGEIIKRYQDKIIYDANAKAGLFDTNRR